MRKQLSTSAVKMRAAQPDSSNAGKVRAAASFASVRFAGVFTADGDTGTTQAIQHHGPIDPYDLTLGAGVPCAVGTTSTGALCRVTDPLCVSRLNYVGWCDEAGTVFVAPRKAEHFNPVDFGAVGDNETDDSPAFAAMFAAMGNGDTCFIPIPPVKYYLGSPLRPDRSVRIIGASMERCTLRRGVGPGIEFRRAYETGAGDATKSHLSGINLQCTRETFTEWSPATVYVVGDKRRCKLGSTSLLNARFQEDAGVHFECITGGTSGADQPEWSLVPDDVTVDGTVRWKTVSHAGIRISTSQVTVEMCTISETTDDGIYAHGDNLQTFADSTIIRGNHVLYGDGNGIHVRGYDGNASVIDKNTISNFPRGAIGLDAGFLSNTWTGNDGAGCRRSFVGTGGTSATTWIGNYWEGDSAPPKIKRPNVWIGGSGSGMTFAAETNAVRLLGSFVGSVPVDSSDGTRIVSASLGLDDGGGAGLGSYQIDTDFSPMRTVWVAGDADDPAGCHRTQWRNLFDTAIELTGEKSMLGPGRHRYARGLYIGKDTAAFSRKATFVTSLPAPPSVSPSPELSAECGRYLWRKGDVVHNCNAGDIGVTPGWIAARNGGWGSGRSHGGRVWSTANPNWVWFIGEGVEPSTPNGKVYRLLRFELYSGGVWISDPTRVQAALVSEPTWPTSDGATVIEQLDSTHRIVWECWGDVGMTWAVLPAPTTQVTT